MSSENNNTGAASTASSYVNSAIGAVQSAIGGLTGNAATQQAGRDRQTQAQHEYEASQTTAVKGAGFTATSEGGLARDNTDRTAGSWNQTLGSAKEAVGGLIGSESLKQSGRDQNLNGQTQEARGQASDFFTGASERAKGAVGSTLAGLSGNREAESAYNAQHADGKAQQRGAEHDIRKQAEAEQQRQ